ncbi:MAG TPA: hypothetical protein ENG24_01150 [Thermoplasmatales archaeon]|nr:hypothetical protein [Thermoplasmatales archaeon]
MHNNINCIRRGFRKFEKNIVPLIVLFLFFASFINILIPNAAAVDKPDLVVDNFKIISPIGTIHKNDIVDFSIRVKNVGTASLSTTVTLALCIDNVLVNSTTISSLGIGSSITVTLNWKADVIGTHTAIAFIDYYGNVDESNEENNAQSISMTIEERSTDIEVGSISVYPSELWVNETVYVNSTITNLGKDATGDVTVKFYVNNSQIDSWTILKSFLTEGKSYDVSFEWIPSKPGAYTLKIIIPEGSGGDTNKNNNIAEREVYVKSREVSLRIINVTSDIPYKVTKNNETAVSAGGTASYKIEIKNTGTESDTFNVTTKKLYGSNNWNLAISKSSFTLLSGETDIFVINITSPSDAQNNEKAVFKITAQSTSDSNKNVSLILTVKVLTDLSVEDVRVYGDLCITGKKADITVSIVNKKAYAKNIAVEIYVDEQLVNYTTVSSLNKGESRYISVIWNIDVDLEIGYHTVKVKVDPMNSTPEYNETNNERSYSIVVMKEPVWWNSSWHYRKAFAVDGINKGNISIENLNFTEMLNDLGIYGKTFDEDSVRVIRYSSDGSILDENITFDIERKSGFDNKTNALFDLNVSAEGNGIKYYCIYFDVVENNLNQPSKSSSCPSYATGYRVYISKVYGWNGEIIKPKVTDYFSPAKNINVTIQTQASADNITIEFYKNKIKYDSKTRYLTSKDNLNWYLPDNKPVSFGIGEEGKWIIKAICRDKAGYTTTVESYFHIGKPDLMISDIHIPSKIYEQRKVTLRATVKCANSSVSDIVAVKFEIPEENITEWQNISSMEKDEERTLNFSWIPTKYGTYDAIIKIDPNGNIIESNEKNNQKTVQINVLGLPDLTITNISIDSPVDEGSSVNATLYVKNKGHAPASGCKITIYATQGSTLYYSKSEEVYNTTVEGSIPNDGDEEYYIGDLPVWDEAPYGPSAYMGKWLIGAKIIPDIGDLTPGDNYASTITYVNRSENNPPKINKIIANDKILYPDNEPLFVELGNDVTIFVNATDESGIYNVTLTLTYPDGSTYFHELSQYETNLWSYNFTPPYVGEYSFYVNVTDASYNKNKRTSGDLSFSITGDVTPPNIKDFYATNFDNTFKIGGRKIDVLLQNGKARIRAEVTDNVEVETVIANITYPNGYIAYVRLASEGDADWYSNYTGNLSMLGLYAFNIYATDTSGNHKVSTVKTFWVTYSVNDTDSDGMPDKWEINYKLDPTDPNDASSDPDNDGYTNVEEYLNGTNPRDKSYWFLIWDKIMENWKYSLIILILLIILTIICLYGIWRNRKR